MRTTKLVTKPDPASADCSLHFIQRFQDETDELRKIDTGLRWQHLLAKLPLFIVKLSHTPPSQTAARSLMSVASKHAVRLSVAVA